MKAVFISDTHLNTSTYEDTGSTGIGWRSQDFKDAFEKSVDYCIKTVPDYVFILGDISDHPHPDNVTRGFFSRQINRLSKEEIETHILIGNHDADKDGHMLLDVEELEIPRVYIWYDTAVFDREGHRFFIFPQTPEVENKQFTMRERFLDFVKEQKEAVKHYDGTTFLLGHFPIFGAAMNDGGINVGGDSVFVEDVELLGCDYSLFGDFHKHQKVGKGEVTRAFYVGSLERKDVSDLDSPKGFMTYDSEKEDDDVYGKLRFVQNSTARPMFMFSGGLEILEDAVALGGEAKDAIVRLKFIGSPDDAAIFSDKIMDVKKEMENRLGVKHFRYSTKRIDKEQDQVADEVIKEMESKETDVEDAAIKDIITNDVNKSDFTDEGKEALMALAIEVMHTVEKKKALQ